MASLLAAFGGCGTTTGTTPDAPTPRVLWKVESRGWGVPAVDESFAYFLTIDHALIAVDKRAGVVRWRGSLGVGAPEPPGFSVVRAGTVLSAVDNGVLYAFQGDRPARLFTFVPPAGALEDWITADAATIYAGSSNGRLYAVDAASGAQRWMAQVSGDAQAMGPRLRDGVIYVGLRRFDVAPTEGGVAAVDATTGDVRWTRMFTPASPTRGTGCHGRVVFTASGDVVAAAADGQIYALDPATGATRWTASSLTNIPAIWGGDPAMDDRPLVVVGDMIIAGSSPGYLVGLDASTGAERWRSRANQGSAVFPLVASADLVFATHAGGQMVAFDARTGAVRWTAGEESSRGAFSQAPFLESGVLYVSGYQALYALRAAP